jgi:hypothetical protein
MTIGLTQRDEVQPALDSGIVPPMARLTPVTLLLLACAGPSDLGKGADGGDGPPDSGGEDGGGSDTSVGEPRVCTPTTMTLQNDFPQEVLPILYDHRHTQQGIAVGDVDGDGWLDAVLAYGGGAIGLRNDGDGDLILDPSMTDNGGPLPSAQSAALADLDADGDLDLYLGRDRGWLAEILTNDGDGHFTSVTLPNATKATMTGAFADFDGDLDLDLFVGATVTDSDGAAVADGTVTSGEGDQLFLRQPDGAYADATDQAPPEDMFGWTFQGSPIDYDLDGDLDIYLAHDWGPYIQPNRMLRNDGTAHFTRDADCACELVQYAMGAAVGDANEDGLPDLYSTNIGGAKLQINLGDGTFADATLALGADIPPEPTSLTSWSTTFLDINQDSYMDIATVYGQLGQPELIGSVDGTAGMEDGEVQYDVLLTGTASGTFERPEVGWNDGERKRGLAVGDFDRDGTPDLLTAGKYFMRQWRTGGGCGAGVRVLLEGKGLNRTAIGAKVEAQIGERRVTQWMLPSVTFGSNAPELYFGVGAAQQIDSFTVTWPDGSVAEAEAAAPGETLTLSWD